MTMPHNPVKQSPNGAHYERLSRTVVRLDRTLGPHHSRRSSVLPIAFDLAALTVMVIAAVMLLLGWRPF